MKAVSRWLGCAVVAAVLACASPAASGTQTPTKPKLVVLITVDQMRADYPDRWAHQLTGGLGRLVQSGVLFTNAVHDHAITSTSPGHAAIGSGRLPFRTGISSNDEGVEDPNVRLVAGAGAGASPASFRGTTLADWIAERDRRTRVFSVSYKDRAAILPVGRRRADVYWYSGSGVFTTSTYYRSDLPDWVRQFNARALPAMYSARTWELLLPESAYPEPDTVAVENGGRRSAFPHDSRDTPGYATSLLESTPWVDELTFQFALHGVRALRLGQGPQTDFLSISLSATDRIGHRYGPDSREMHDQLLRLDRSLGAFLDSLFLAVDPSSVVIALTSDHGVAPIPEVLGHDGRTGGHRVSTAALLAPIRAGLAERGVWAGAVWIDFGGVSIDRAALAAGGIDADSLLRELAAHALRTPGIARVDRPGDLARADTVRDEIARRWLHTLSPNAGWSLVITVEPYSYWTPYPANHGSPHDYDARVPLIFWGRPFARGRIERQVRVVDLAPTMARALGIEPLEPTDGVVLRDALR